MDTEIEQALENLIRYCLAPGDADPALAYHCRLVAEAVFQAAPALATAVQQDPEGQRKALRSILQQVVRQGPARRSLVRQLARHGTGPAQATVSGTGNVTLVGSFVVGDIRVGAGEPPTEQRAAAHRPTEEGPVADAELWLQRHEAGHYRVVMSFTPPGSTAIEQLLNGECLAPIRIEPLNEVIHDPEVYGERLTAMLCAEPPVAQCLLRVYDRARGAPLRLRLRLEGDDTLLTSIRWELLRLPSDGDFLFASAAAWLSRLPQSRDDAPVTIAPLRELRAVIAVAAPSDLSAYGLAPIDAQAEVTLGRQLLGSMQVTVVAQASLSALVEAFLKDVHVLYLVAHGAFIEGRPVVYLAGSHGQTEPTSADFLVERMKGSPNRPALVILATCQSAGQSHHGRTGLAALGPSLARIGVGAVLAMQDNVSIEALHAGMPAFWTELQAHGVVDRAVAAMRNLLAAAKHPWWQPVLYMRLRDGRIFTR